jgi:hypothetical protein
MEKRTLPQEAKIIKEASEQGVKPTLRNTIFSKLLFLERV